MVRLIIWLKPFAGYILIAWITAILIVSSVPSLPVLKIQTANSEIRLDYLIHFCEYGILAFMAFLTFSGKEFRMKYRRFVMITICVALFAVLDEFHQKYIPGRSFNVKDILSNFTGILAALILCAAFFRKVADKITRAD
jgi:VanZ family protein